MRDHVKNMLSFYPRLYYFAKRCEIIYRYFLKKVHDNDFYIYKNFKDIKKGLFIDIGANCGQSAVSFNIFNKSWSIISFEPNMLLEKELMFIKKLLGNKFDYYMCGIGEENKSCSFFVPEKNNILITGEGTFVKEELNQDVTVNRLGDSFSIKEFVFEIKQFKNFNLRPDIIKIDTQGYEMNVLKSLKDALESFHPILMIENPSTIFEKNILVEYLNNIGYDIFNYDYKKNILKKYIYNSVNLIAIPNVGSSSILDICRKIIE